MANLPQQAHPDVVIVSPYQTTGSLFDMAAPVKQIGSHDMKISGIIGIAFILSTLTFQAGAEDAGIKEMRSGPLPLPAASDELRQAIANSPQDDFASTPVPQTGDEWRALIAGIDAPQAATIPAIVEAFGVKVEPGTISGVNIHWIIPPEIADENEDRLFVVLHGGGYVLSGGDAGTFEGIAIATNLKIPVLSIDYRMPPDHPFPAAIDDVVAVYRETTKEHSPQSIALGGTSAGGGLTLASVMRFAELGMPLPAALFAGTPWTDLTKTGDSMYINDGIDKVFSSYDGVIEGMAKLYAGKHDLKNPLVSPVYGDFGDFPPTIFVTGTRDILLSHTVRTHRKMRAAGVEAELHVYEGFSHADYLMHIETPESVDTFREIEAFVGKHLK